MQSMGDLGVSYLFVETVTQLLPEASEMYGAVVIRGLEQLLSKPLIKRAKIKQEG